MRRELRELKGNKEALDIYIEARNKLVNSGVFNALRALGRPTRYETGKDINQMASEASWSSGWNDCLDSLLHFNEMYLTSEDESGIVNTEQRADFNALDLAVASGFLTKEEADERKQSGTYSKPESTQYTSNITKSPTR